MRVCSAGVPSCGSDEFTCRNGYCVKVSLRCNGVANCNDASDEDDEYGSLFYSISLFDFINLQKNDATSEFLFKSKSCYKIV